MKRHSTSTPTAVITETESRNERGTRLHGGWLVFARVLWVVLFILGVSVTGTTLPGYLTLLKKTCIPVYFYSCMPQQLSPESAQAFQDLGLAMSDYAFFVFALSIAIAIVWFVVGLVIFWRKSDDWVALLVSSALIIYTGNFDFWHSYIVSQIPLLLQFFSVLTIFLVCFFFPSGRFAPRWLGWPAIVGLVWLLDPYILPDSSPLSAWYWPAIYLFLLFTLLGVCVFSQIYRYRRESSLLQRQQTKWVVFALSITLLGIVIEEYIFLAPLVVLPTLLYQLVYMLVWGVFPVIIPLSFGVAILRYRLWDIDRVINRTLVYGVLTVSLALIYVGLIIALQALLRGIINQTSDVAIVASTLAIAALFQPLRQGIQRLVDRRFYRSKYDAAKIVAAYSATLRQEVDLDQLREQLLAVVQETMQPAHVSLWLRKPERDGKHNSGKTNALVSHSEEMNL